MIKLKNQLKVSTKRKIRFLSKNVMIYNYKVINNL
jgi:hypothetical protein